MHMTVTQVNLDKNKKIIIIYLLFFLQELFGKLFQIKI